MKLTKEIMEFFSVLKSRFKGLRIEIKVLLLISVISILSIEFVLNKYHATYQWQYDFGVLFLKLCYSYFSAFIFYYLVVYAPKERKRVKTFVLINNNIGEIIGLQKKILHYLYMEIYPNSISSPNDYSEEEIREICKRINPKNSIVINYFGIISFNNHYELISYFLNKMKTLISELIVLYDILDDEILSNLTLINNHITRLLEIDITKSGNKDLEFYTGPLYFLNKECNVMHENKKKYHYRYYFQHSKRFRR